MPIINTMITETTNITKNGLHDVAKYTTANVNVTSSEPGENHIIVVDYDGTVLKEAYLDEGDTFTLPEPPTHSRLIFDGWNSSATVVNNEIIVGNSDVIVGALYKTESGLTEFDIIINEGTGLTVKCDMSGNKDWGDGTTNSETCHTYSAAGSYIITCDGTTISSYCCRDPNDYGESIYIYRNIRIGELVTEIMHNAFGYLYSLQTITYPNQNILFSSYCMSSCQSLKCCIFPSNINITNLDMSYTLRGCNIEYVVLPNNITKIDNYFFEYCRCLKCLIIPSSVVEIGVSAISYVNSLEKIVFPSSVTMIRSNNLYESNPIKSVEIYGSNVSIQSNFTYNTYSIRYVTIPNGATISNQCFNCTSSLNKFILAGYVPSISNGSCCYSSYAVEYDLSGITNVPSLGNEETFSNNPQVKIKVPTSLYNDFMNDTNWSKFAYQIEAV